MEPNRFTITFHWLQWSLFIGFSGVICSCLLSYQSCLWVCRESFLASSICLCLTSLRNDLLLLHLPTPTISPSHSVCHLHWYMLWESMKTQHKYLWEDDDDDTLESKTCLGIMRVAQPCTYRYIPWNNCEKCSKHWLNGLVVMNCGRLALCYIMHQLYSNSFSLNYGKHDRSMTRSYH